MCPVSPGSSDLPQRIGVHLPVLRGDQPGEVVALAVPMSPKQKRTCARFHSEVAPHSGLAAAR